MALQNGRRPARRPIAPEDETFSWLVMKWNVTQAREILRRKRGESHHTWVQVADYVELLQSVKINHRHSRTVDLDDPLLLATTQWGLCVIDGWHRIYRVHRDGVPLLPAYRLSLAETKAIQHPYHARVMPRRPR